MDELDALLDGPSRQSDPQTAANNVQINERVRRIPEAVEDGRGNLGIDEQIKVRKPRAPIAKLNEERLLSEKGIPELRRVTKRIKFKGKGHEFSDVANLLTTYQLWLDSMFPKANFIDGLELIEKLGHKKRLQVMRREWIKEDYPKNALDGDDGMDSQKDQPDQDTTRNDSGDISMGDDDLFVPEVGPPASTHAPASDKSQTTNEISTNAQHNISDEQPKEDELDALLAEQSPKAPVAHRAATQQDEFADEMEAMGDNW